MEAYNYKRKVAGGRTAGGAGKRIGTMGSSSQQYCLRWNNHRSNLLLVFEHLFHTEAFTDVTLACDGHSVKCHKMVLAACSSYFQSLFLENDCRHPIVILKDILYSEVKAILEYMYKGEVNVAQDQLSGLLKAAETLKVKGLVEDHGGQRGGASPGPAIPQSPYHPVQPAPQGQPNRPPLPTTLPPTANPDYEPNTNPPSYPSIKINNSTRDSGPLKFIPNDSIFDAPYNASGLPDRNSLPFPLWSNKLSAGSPKHAYGNSNSTYESSQTEPVSLKKKKSLSLSSGKDTPILRTVLGHTSLQSNSAEPLHKSLKYSLTSSPTNGPNIYREGNDKGLPESPDHFMEDSVRSVDSDKMHEDNHSFSLDSDDKIGLASYLQTQNQKPEWKRYKQYTRNDIMAAIEAVRGGMSALQAARKYGVPSRTLYDKVKKLGITTNRPYRKGSFPMSPYQGHKMEDGSGYSPEDLPLDISTNRNGTISPYQGLNQKLEESSGHSRSPEEQALDISNPRNGGSLYQGLHQKLEDLSAYGQEDQPLDISTSRNGNGGLGLHHGQEGDSDKMDSDQGSSIKQEHETSLPMDDMIDDPHYQGSEENPDNGSSGNCSSPSPQRGLDHPEKEEDSGIMVGQRLIMGTDEI